MKVLILDDFYFRSGKFRSSLKSIGITDITHVTTAQDCIKKLSKHKYDVIFLDYHLDSEQFEIVETDNTGVKVAQWMKNHPKNVNNNAIMIIHSSNEIGAAEMKEYLPKAHCIRRAWEEDMFHHVIELIKSIKV